MINLIPAEIDGIIIDGGANNGLFSFLASYKFPGKIYAFEPSPVLSATLEKNFLNKNIKLVKKALSDKTGLIKLFISSTADQLGSTKEMNVAYFEKNPRKIKELTVDAITLEDFIEQEQIENISILKLDLQGSEYDVLKNAESVLRRTDYLLLEIMFLESSVFDLIELARKYFQYHIVINPVLFGADILFSKKEVHDHGSK